MTGPGRPHDVTGLTTPDLDRARRDLAASLALSRPGSPAREIIAAHIAAVDTERAQRPGAVIRDMERREAAGGTGIAE